MKTLRTHMKLSTAVQRAAQLRQEIKGDRLTYFRKICCRFKYAYESFRIRCLIQELHTL